MQKKFIVFFKNIKFEDITTAQVIVQALQKQFNSVIEVIKNNCWIIKTIQEIGVDAITQILTSNILNIPEQFTDFQFIVVEISDIDGWLPNSNWKEICI